MMHKLTSTYKTERLVISMSDDNVRRAHVDKPDSEELVRRMNEQSNALAPISSLPPELMVKIFKLGNGEVSKGKFRGNEEGRKVVGRVCRAWRQ